MTIHVVCNNMQNNHLGLLCDIGELSTLLGSSSDIETFLERIVETVAKHIRANVCSIYIYEELTNELVLKAATGLSDSSVGRIRLQLGEGLVGTVLASGQPLCEAVASANANYLHFDDTDEEKFEAFLGVPILRGIEKIGVLVAQRSRKNAFTDMDVMALRATASQLASAIENARILMAMRTRRKEQRSTDTITGLQVIKGQPAAEGSIAAKALVLDRDKTFRILREHEFTHTYTLEDFERAIAVTEEQLEALQTRVEERLSDIAALIFDAHMMMLKDSEFAGTMIQRIKEGVNPPRALLDVAAEFVDVFSHSDNAYMREKSKDVEDLALRVCSNLVEEEFHSTINCQGKIVIARDLYPSEILKLSSEDVGGIILVSGGTTSHVAILANSLGIPMVIVDRPRLTRLDDNVEILLDGHSGEIYINPPGELVEHHRRRAHDMPALKAQMKPETFTADGQRIHLMANVNLLVDATLANDLQAEGVGLYRTEFPFLVRADFPSEEEQFVVYQSLFKKAAGQQVTLRTLDIGGDKVLAYYDNPKEANPVLGMRSIRFALAHPDILEQQIRAVLRAAADRGIELRIMFPMIASVDDFRAAKAVILTCAEALRNDGVAHYDDPAIGMMVEIPSVVEIIDQLAIEADFMCIGTNDFIQYMLAVDRSNEKVAPYFQPHHPAVLRALKRIADAASRHQTDVSVCGEMAHEPQYIPFFLGIGIRTLSLAPRYLPKAQQIIEGTSIEVARAQANAMLQESTLAGIEELLRTAAEAVHTVRS
jgi:phosphotransferase system enzyme I (PtsP)